MDDFKWPIRIWVLFAGIGWLLSPYFGAAMTAGVIASGLPKVEQIQKPLSWWLWSGKWEMLAGLSMLFGLIAPKIYRTARAKKIGLWVHSVGLAAIMHVGLLSAYAYFKNNPIRSQADLLVSILIGIWVLFLMSLMTVIPAPLSFWLFRKETLPNQSLHATPAAGGRA